MNIEHYVSPSTTWLIGATVLHSFWQIGLIGILSWGISGRLRGPEQRYAACVVAMGLMLAVPIATMAWLPREAMPLAGGGAQPIAIDVAEPTGSTASSWSTWIALAWIAGAFVMHLRLAWNLVRTLLLRYVGCESAPRCWVDEVVSLSAQLRVHPKVRVLESHWAASPMVIGWLRPVVLLPSFALTGLSPDQLRALIVHELAHVRRYDYLVNLLQALFEALLFFHPAAWWLSRRLRVEREYCCDDAAVSMCGDRLLYARALSELADLRATPMPAMAANGGSLMKRIRRIVEPSSTSGKTGITGAIGALSGVILLSWAGYSYGAVGEGCCCCKGHAKEKGVVVVKVKNAPDESRVDARRIDEKFKVAPAKKELAVLAATTTDLETKLTALQKYQKELGRAGGEIDVLERVRVDSERAALESLLAHVDQSEALAEKKRAIAKYHEAQKLHPDAVAPMATKMALELAMREAELVAAKRSLESSLAAEQAQLEERVALKEAHRAKKELSNQVREIENLVALKALEAKAHAELVARMNPIDSEADAEAMRRLDEFLVGLKKEVASGELSENAAKIILKRVKAAPRATSGAK